LGERGQLEPAFGALAPATLADIPQTEPRSRPCAERPSTWLLPRAPFIGVRGSRTQFSPAVHLEFIRDLSLVALITISEKDRRWRTTTGKLDVAFELTFEELRSTITETGAAWDAGRTDFTAMSEQERQLLLGYIPGPDDTLLEDSERMTWASLESFRSAMNEAFGYPAS
jgi:hypothetical protein